MKSSLEHKTVRPGSLGDYSFYYSNRSLPRVVQPATTPQPKSVRRWKPIFVVLFIVVIAGFAGVRLLGGTSGNDQNSSAAVSTPSAEKTAASASVNECAAGMADHWVKISISKRHLWACNGTTQVHDSKVITGMEQHPSTLTPVGTYKIYAKVADTVLTGSDETGSWRDPVSYWMPFLDNQYGTYGFHDATWRNNDEFGNVGPNSDKASHGCVELPIATSKWLYGWASVGTTVTVES